MIGVTGVTGKLGGQVAKVLSQKGLKAIHIARSPERAIKYDNAEIRKAAAKMAGVEHIVYISFYNNKKDATFTLSRDHYQTEKYIKEQGLQYTFLRDNFYIDFFLDLCFEYGEIRGPAGDGLVSAVARRDAADIVVAVMLNVQEYENKVLNLTGPRDLSMKDIVEVVGEKLGKEIFYINESVEEAYESRKVWEAEQWQYDSWVSTYTAIAKGEQSGVSLDIEKILNRPATSLEDLVKEYVK